MLPSILMPELKRTFLLDAWVLIAHVRKSLFPENAARLPEGCGLVIGSTPRSIKNVEPVLSPVPQCKGLRIARLVETNNAESPTQNVYRKSLHAVHISRHAAIRIHYGLSINTLRGVPVALFLTNRSKLRSSYTVKTKASRKRLCP